MDDRNNLFSNLLLIKLYDLLWFTVYGNVDILKINIPESNNIIWSFMLSQA